MSARWMGMTVLGLLAFLAGCRADSPYHVKDGAWYWKDDRLDLPASAALKPLVVPQSDGATFEALSNHFAKDKTHVWYSDINVDNGPGVIENLVLPNADPATFVVIDGDYGKDAKRVYQRATLLKDADPQTFTVPR